MSLQELESQDELISELVTNTQVASGRRPRVTFMKTSFKMRRSPLMPSAGLKTWTDLSPADPRQFPFWRSPLTPLYQQSQQITCLLFAPRCSECHGHGFPIRRVCNKETVVMETSPFFSFLRSVSLFFWEFFWGNPSRQFLLKCPTRPKCHQTHRCTQ